MSTSPNTYDFLSDDNEPKWRGILSPALRKIQKQVHPRLDIDDETVDYLETLILKLLGHMCSVHPHTLSDVESHVQKTFAYPIDVWSLSEAQDKLARFASKKRGVFLFPIDKLHYLLINEVFGYKVDVTVVQFIMGILDYVAADILKLAGNFVKNTRKPAAVIIVKDVQVSMSADPALQALFEPLQPSSVERLPGLNIGDVEITTDRHSMKYDELLRDLMENESQFIRQMNLILKVFYPVFLDNPGLFPDEEVDTIFDAVNDVHAFSVQLLASIEEMVEMASEMNEDKVRYPQIGFCFEDVAESDEFSVFVYYTEQYQEAVMALENISRDPEVCTYFRTLSDQGKLPKLFKEAVQYVLPKALMEPIYHFFYYCTIMKHMSSVTEDAEDHTAFESAISSTLAHTLHVDKESQRFLSKRREEIGMFGRRVGYRYSVKKLIDLQSRIEGWEGSDIHLQATELVKEGSLCIAREGSRRSSRQKLDRCVLLLDGLVLCCKTKKAGTATVAPEYKLKEKISMKGAVTLIDLDDTDDLKFAFELREGDTPGIIFITMSPPEKNEWMSAFTMLMVRSSFERMLDAKLREEESLIPVLVPDAQQYIFGIPDSDDNIIFEEEGRDNQVLIKAGTIHKLVERLTYNEYADPTFVRTFLMTYRSFCKPGELLNLLIERYQIPLPSDPNIQQTPLQREAIKRFKANYVSPVHLRVLNVLRHWVENHYYDFESESAVLDQLKDFVGTVKAKNMQKLVASIHRALHKKEGKSEQSSSDPVFFEPPPSIEWFVTKNKEEFHILSLHPIEFARQLTLVLSDLFRAIHSAELVDASWTKEHKKENSSPHLLKMSRFETGITNWLRHTIVFTENFEERLALCCRLIDIMEELKAMNNFSALFAFNAAFQSSQVYRLKNTWKDIPLKKKQVLDEIQQLASTDKGYKNYKEKLRLINPPCVPFIGMYLTWIVFIKDGNDGKLKGKPDHFINFKKRRMIANILQEIQQYQNTPYCLKAEPSIQEYLQSHDPKENMGDNQFEDYLYDQSVEIEPRDQPYKKAPRKYKGDLKPPNQAGGTLARIVPPILKSSDKKTKPNMSFDDEISSPESNLPASNSTSTLNDSSKDNNEKEDKKLSKDSPPPIPPKLPHTTSLGGLDVASSLPPKPSLPRAVSPKLDTLPESYLTYRPPKQPHHRLPPEIPNNELSSQQPPLPPRLPRANHSPMTPPTPNNDSGLPPPLPVRRSFSPSLSSPSFTPNNNNDNNTPSNNGSPPPLPPRVLPPSSVKSSSPTNEKNNEKNVFEYSGSNSERDSNKPPVLPPRASPSYHSKTLSSSDSSLPPPPIPPKSNR